MMAAYAPDSACDWAVLAAAYVERYEGNTILRTAKYAFAQAVIRNPGYALAMPLFYPYFDSVLLVDPPPFADLFISSVRISYEWHGLGTPVSYSVTVIPADTDSTVTATPEITGTTVREVDSGLVQALGPALTDLVPIDSQFALEPCFDNYPSWLVSLTFEDGTTLDLVTNSSNYVVAGGPWQTVIDGQNYVQFSLEFLRALLDLVDSLRMPWGQPMAMTCGHHIDVFKKAFP